MKISTLAWCTLFGNQQSNWSKQKNVKFLWYMNMYYKINSNSWYGLCIADWCQSFVSQNMIGLLSTTAHWRQLWTFIFLFGFHVRLSSFHTCCLSFSKHVTFSLASLTSSSMWHEIRKLSFSKYYNLYLRVYKRSREHRLEKEQMHFFYFYSTWCKYKWGCHTNKVTL